MYIWENSKILQCVEYTHAHAACSTAVIYSHMQTLLSVPNLGVCSSELPGDCSLLSAPLSSLLRMSFEILFQKQSRCLWSLDSTLDRTKLKLELHLTLLGEEQELKYLACHLLPLSWPEHLHKQESRAVLWLGMWTSKVCPRNAILSEQLKEASERSLSLGLDSRTLSLQIRTMSNFIWN